ncbi:MAG: 16S rRNA (guanine(966)-N(2))-methyltransferase RsmD [Spirochaetes bacterium]|nr:16S rRNA (guanine(966)-N(2))-methyltransferase RsmD [Spirochaetota bacterium]
MKVVTGMYKNQKLFVPKKRVGIRMTTSLVKEAVIDIFRSVIEGSVLLDIFAGGGGMGIEFLSNKASRVVFIEGSHQYAGILKDNLTKLRVEEERYRIICRDYRSALKVLPGLMKEKFDFIFIDPPYFTDYIKRSIEIISGLDICRKDIVIMAEHHNKERIEEDIERFIKYQSRKYGTSILDFWKRNPVWISGK